MKVLIVIIFTLHLIMNSYSQTVPVEYSNLIIKADSLYTLKEYKSSAFKYNEAFKAFDGKGLLSDRYKSACSWALANFPDSAFFQLKKISSKGYYFNLNKLQNEKAFLSLHDKTEWNLLIEQLKHNQDSIESKFDKKLIAKLDSLAKEDQKWRNNITKLHNNELNKDSIDPRIILPNMAGVDLRNGVEVKKIFYKYGFPNLDLVGVRGSQNFWLLVQHQDTDPRFQDSVLTAMKVEVDKGKASKSDYAYLVDRVKRNSGEKQVYGTQLQLNSDGTSYEPQPVIDPAKLNERRKSVKLETIEEYIESMNRRNVGSLKKK